MPSRCFTVDLKFSTTTSAFSANFMKIARPSLVFRFSESDRLLRCKFWKSGPSRRLPVASVCSPGISILMTSAPQSASCRTAVGPARCAVRSRTLNPLSGNAGMSGLSGGKRSAMVSARGARCYRLRSQKIGEIFLRRDQPGGDAEFVGLMAEGVHLRAVLLEAVGVEMGAHQRLGFLQLGLQPGRDIGEIALRLGEHRVGPDERLGQAARQPFIPLPHLAPEHDQVLRREHAGAAEIVLLDRAEIR